MLKKACKLFALLTVCCFAIIAAPPCYAEGGDSGGGDSGGNGSSNDSFQVMYVDSTYHGNRIEEAVRATMRYRYGAQASISYQDEYRTVYRITYKRMRTIEEIWALDRAKFKKEQIVPASTAENNEPQQKETPEPEKKKQKTVKNDEQKDEIEKETEPEDDTKKTAEPDEISEDEVSEKDESQPDKDMSIPDGKPDIDEHSYADEDELGMTDEEFWDVWEENDDELDIDFGEEEIDDLFDEFDSFADAMDADVTAEAEDSFVSDEESLYDATESKSGKQDIPEDMLDNAVGRMSIDGFEAFQEMLEANPEIRDDNRKMMEAIAMAERQVSQSYRNWDRRLGYAEDGLSALDTAGQVSQFGLSFVPGVGWGTTAILDGVRGGVNAYGKDKSLAEIAKSAAIDGGVAAVLGKLGGSKAFKNAKTPGRLMGRIGRGLKNYDVATWSNAANQVLGWTRGEIAKAGLHNFLDEPDVVPSNGAGTS